MYTIGFVFAAHSVFYIIGNILCRTLGSEVTRRTHLLGGLALLILSAVLFMVSNTIISWMIAARAVQGIASAMIQTAATGLIADMYAGTMDGGRDFENAFGHLVTGNLFGAAMGPVVGGVLYTLKGFSFTFLLLALVIGGVGIVASLVLDTPDPVQPPVHYEQHLRDGWVRAAVGGLAVVGWTVSMLDPTLPIHLEASFGAKEAVIGLGFTELILSQQVFMPLIFKLIEGQSGDRPTYIVAAYVMLGAFLLLMFVANQLWICFLMLLFFGFAAALVVATLNAELADAMGNDDIPSTINLSSYFLKEAGFRAGTCLGPLVGAAFVGDSLTPFFITAAASVAFIPIYFYSKESSLRLKL